ncbi:MAG: LysM peptidoglycan-binding domain-containing protein [Alphaproteobacteria bacterium]|nr:LysM peptidoglycan-binding domain-containing protein [Alphaproteobacteria bacterium]
MTRKQTTKRSTDEMINGAVDRQQSWLSNRRAFTRAFLRRFNVFNKHENEQKQEKQKAVAEAHRTNKSVLAEYWFPIMCACFVVAIAVFVMLFKINTPVKVIVPNIPEPIIKPVEKTESVVVDNPTFDLVRIDKMGNIVVAGRTQSESNVSILINKKVVATEHTNTKGEFVYSPASKLKPGNYVVSLIDTDKDVKSKDSVFLYVPENDYSKSVSLLMTEDGNKILQAPEGAAKDLTVSKIDYLSNGRIVVTGRAIPRLRVSLTLNDKYIGSARVSDYRTFGFGADVKKLQSGKEYKINVRLHDDEGKTIENIEHKFIMPEMTGCDDTFYTVRRGDSLWVISRNFLRKGALFSLIADCNDIENPNLIFPKQVLQIPVND